MNQTTNYDLDIYESGDPANFMVNYNGNMNKIDAAIAGVATTAGTAGTAAATAQAAAEAASTAATAAQNTATAAQNTANSKAAIDDTAASSTTTYSGTKINSLVNAKASIDDTGASPYTTYSSLKIEQDLNTVVRTTTSSDVATSANENITLGASATKFNHVVTLSFTISTNSLLDVSVNRSAITIGTLNSSFEANNIPNSLAYRTVSTGDKFDYVISISSGGSIKLTVQKDNATIDDFKNLMLYASVTYVID